MPSIRGRDMQREGKGLGRSLNDTAGGRLSGEGVLRLGMRWQATGFCDLKSSHAASPSGFCSSEDEHSLYDEG